MQEQIILLSRPRRLASKTQLNFLTRRLKLVSVYSQQAFFNQPAGITSSVLTTLTHCKEEVEEGRFQLECRYRKVLRRC